MSSSFRRATYYKLKAAGVGCQVDGKSPKDVGDAVDSGEYEGRKDLTSLEDFYLLSAVPDS